MRLRRALAVAVSTIPVACSSGQAQISAPRARQAATTTSVPPEPTTTTAEAAPETVPGTVPPAPPATVAVAATPRPSLADRHGPLSAEPGASRALASWYGEELKGSPTATGEPFNPDGLTFAHRSMAFGTAVRFCGPLGCVVARCNDRGPFVGGRMFDLSRAAFSHVQILSAGVAEVTWEVVG